MNVIRTLTSNYVINVGFVAWFSAQILKVIFTFIVTNKIVLERLVGAGGMPSSHSALTCGIAIAIARKVGYSSPEFGLAVAFAAIVMYDAMGVRRAAGEQAKVINKMIFDFPFFKRKYPVEKEIYEDWELIKALQKDKIYEGKFSEEGEEIPILSKELKEFLGHTPVEVLGGCVLGILVAMFMPVK